MSSTRNKVITATVVAGSFLTVYHIISHHHSHHHHHNDMFDDVDTKEVEQLFEDPKERPFLAFIPQILSNLNVNTKGGTVVDIGAGTGVLMKHFTKVIGNDGTYIALELSKSFVEHLNNSISEQKIKNAIVVNNTMNSFCLPPDFKGKIDVFVCLNVWHHVEDKKSALEEIYNNLQDGGAFMLMDFKQFTDSERNGLNLPNLTIFKIKLALYTIGSWFSFGHKHSLKEFREMSKRHGFESVMQMARCMTQYSPTQIKDEILQKSELVFEKDVMDDVLQNIFVHIYRKQ